MSDFQLEDTLFFRFTTRAFATGIPTVLAGTPAIDIYENDSTTQVIVGESLTVDFDGVGGLNLITITATAASGFEAGKSYCCIIQAGTVGGVSVVGEVVKEFTLDMSAAAKDLANGTDGLGAIKSDTAATLVDTAEIGAAGAGLTAINLPNQTMDITGDITGNLSGSVGSVTGAVGSVTGAVGSVSGNVDGSTASVTGAVGSVTGAVGSVAGNVDGSTASVTGAVGSVAGNVDGSTASVTGAVGSVTGAVGSVTGAVGSVAGNVDGSTASVTGAVGSVAGNVDGSVASNVELGPAEVLTQVNTALDTAISELSQTAPTATPTMRTGLMLLYMALRNRLDVDTSGTDEFQVHNDAGVVIAKKLLTDDGADFSEAEMVSGP